MNIKKETIDDPNDLTGMDRYITAIKNKSDKWQAVMMYKYPLLMGGDWIRVYTDKDQFNTALEAIDSVSKYVAFKDIRQVLPT